MGYLAEATQEALDCGDESVVMAHFAYAEELMSQAGPELANALQVSYLEYINYDKEYPNKIRPRLLLPALLNRSLAELEQHLREVDEHIRRTRQQEKK